MHSRTNWTPFEDELLCKLANQLNAKQWSEIEKKFNAQFPQRERTCKQLRQRFKNFLQYEKGSALIKEWSEAEEKLLFQQYLEKGSKWTSISKLLPGKSEAYIKNKFYGGLRKALRRINQIRKTQVIKFSKPIKYSSLIRVLEIKEKVFSLPEELREEAMALREKIVIFSQKNLSGDHSAEVMQFCEELFRFNFQSRCYRAKKSNNKARRSSVNSGDQSDVSQQMIEEEKNQENVESCINGQVGEKNIFQHFSKSVENFYEIADKDDKLPLAFPRKVSCCVSAEYKGQTTDDKESDRNSGQQLIRFGAFVPCRPINFLQNSLRVMEQLQKLRRELKESNNTLQIQPFSDSKQI